MRSRLIPLAIVMLVVTSCSSSDSTDTTTTSSAGTVTTTSGSGATTSTTTAATSSSSTTAAPDASGPLSDCVVGVWELDSQAFFDDLFAEISEAEGVGAFSFVDGRYLLTVGADGSIVNERDQWTFAVEADGSELQMRLSSRQTGTYTIENDVLSTTMQAGEPPTVEMLLDGEPFDIPGGVVPIEPPEAEFTGATVACNGDMLTATASGFTTTWIRTG